MRFLEFQFYLLCRILLTLIFLGRYLEIYSQKSATDAVSKLFKSASNKAILVQDIDDGYDGIIIHNFI